VKSGKFWSLDKQLANKRLVTLLKNISKYFDMIDPSQKHHKNNIGS
jgi:hypothetical protein